MTRATSGRTSRRVFAIYDRASSSWRTLRVISPKASGKSSERWPQWGMTRRGVAFELATPADVTNGSGCSSLLPTPTAWLGRRDAHSQGDPERWTNPERSNELSDFVAWLMGCGAPSAEQGGTPSPTSGTPTGGGPTPKLLPTPTARDGKDTGDLSNVPENSLLPRVVWNHFSRPPQQPTGSDGP